MGIRIRACDALDHLEYEGCHVDPLCQSNVRWIFLPKCGELHPDILPNSEGLRARKLLNGVIVWVICGFVGDELALFLICRPLSQYWAVPPINRKFPMRLEYSNLLSARD